MTLQSSKPTALAVNALLSPDKAGFMQLWGGSPTAIPTGWLKCDGSAVSRATYSTLFGVVGVLFGVGDGATTFNLPLLTIDIDGVIRSYIIKLYDDTGNATYSFSNLSITQYAAIGSAPAQSGATRLTNNESVSWRNFAGSGDLPLKVNASNDLEYNGHTLMTSGGEIASPNFPFLAITGTFALTDVHYIVSASGAANYTVTLPTAVGNQGRIFIIKSQMNAGILLTIATTGGQTIDGALVKDIATFEALHVVSNATNWEII
jgi:microcystin-dependent protein